MAFSFKNVASGMIVLSSLSCATGEGDAWEARESEESPEESELHSAPGQTRILLPDARSSEGMQRNIPEHIWDSSAQIDLGMQREPRLTSAERRRQQESRLRTEQEISGGQSRMEDRYGPELEELDRTLGLKESESEKEYAVPSLIKGIKIVKALFKQKNFLDSLVETNDLLRFYPKNSQLLKMKGTLHQRLGQLDLALLSYRRAQRLAPSRRLRSAIQYLELRLLERERLRNELQQIEAERVKGKVVPGKEVEIEYKAVPAQKIQKKTQEITTQKPKATPVPEAQPVKTQNTETKPPPTTKVDED